MKPFDEEWVEELRQQAQTDPSFFAFYDRITQLEPLCKQIIASLPPDRQGIMEAYLQVMKKMEVWQTHHAYLCGIQIGERRKDKK